MTTHEVKIVLIGDSGVGKTSLVYRFVINQFDETKESTMGAGFMTKMLSSQGQNIRFMIWDTAGQEKYHSLASMYFKNADVAVLVYDVSSQQSYQGLLKWINDLKTEGPPNLSIPPLSI